MPLIFGNSHIPVPPVVSPFRCFGNPEDEQETEVQTVPVEPAGPCISGRSCGLKVL